MNLKTTHNTLIISKELFIAKRHEGININVLDLSTVKKKHYHHHLTTYYYKTLSVASLTWIKSSSTWVVACFPHISTK